MKLQYGRQQQKCPYFPEKMSEMQLFIEKKFFSEQSYPGPAPGQHQQFLSSLNWEGVECYYYDSEGDKNYISQDEDLKDAF